MLELLATLAASAAALVWLWAWQRYLPRPPERQIEEEFAARPSASLAFFGFVLFMRPADLSPGVGPVCT